MIYTGIGSRSTPVEVFHIIYRIARFLGGAGWILRSGAAPGADTAFEDGCNSVSGKKEIYLPWKGFQASKSELYTICPQALKLAQSVHPNWNACTPGARALHARNAYQVLGQNLATPSDLLVCWTPNGQPVGGTRTAIVLAQSTGIPVYNLANRDQLKEILEYLNAKEGK